MRNYTKERERTNDENEADTAGWGHLRNPFLASRPAPEQARIFDLADGTAAQLSAWARSYPFMRQSRVRPLCLSVAAAAPFCEVPALLSTAHMSLWVFALDDLFDEESLPDAELERLGERLQAIAAGEGTQPEGTPMERALTAIRDELSGYPLFSELEQNWIDALRGTIREMQRENQWRQHYQEFGAAMLPSYEAYLACGRYSIGGPPHVWSTLITIGDQSTPTRLATLVEMEQLASTCIRLANDLQSHQKELEEGKINSLVILGDAFVRAGHSPDEVLRLAQKAVRDEIARRLANLIRLQPAAKTKTGQPEAAVVNIARFVCDFYQRHDFHTFDSETG